MLDAESAEGSNAAESIRQFGEKSMNTWGIKHPNLRSVS
jgi:hypothetical protein